jgi:DNA-binding transcriptional regulator LsrR (DeoR family)
LLDDFEETTPRIKDDLIFVAGNAAYLPDQFQRSANFLSVTMAELFGAQHLALPKVLDDRFRKRYIGLVDRAALFICGVGSLEFGLMGRYFKDEEWPMPERAVGDLAFNFLDQDGNAVELSGAAREFMDDVNPALDLPKLTHIAANNCVLLILDSEEPAEKTKIAVAALRREYATDVVLGSRLARAILQEY